MFKDKFESLEKELIGTHIVLKPAPTGLKGVLASYKNEANEDAALGKAEQGFVLGDSFPRVDPIAAQYNIYPKGSDQRIGQLDCCVTLGIALLSCKLNKKYKDSVPEIVRLFEESIFELPEIESVGIAYSDNTPATQALLASLGYTLDFEDKEACLFLKQNPHLRTEESKSLNLQQKTNVVRTPKSGRELS